MKKTATLDHQEKEGHGDENFAPRVSKGTFIDGGGTYVTLSESAHSPNKKTGKASGDEV